MKCPHCGQSLNTQNCPSCHSETLAESLFCHRCGVALSNNPPAAPADEDPIDFSKRILCSDGTCIGVVDEKGFCKVCGKPYQGEGA